MPAFLLRGTPRGSGVKKAHGRSKRTLQARRRMTTTLAGEKVLPKICSKDVGKNPVLSRREMTAKRSRWPPTSRNFQSYSPGFARNPEHIIVASPCPAANTFLANLSHFREQLAPPVIRQ